MLNIISGVLSKVFNSKPLVESVSRLNNRYTTYSLIPLVAVSLLSYLGINNDKLLQLIIDADFVSPAIPPAFWYSILGFIFCSLIIVFLYLLFKKDGISTTFKNSKLRNLEINNKYEELQRENKIKKLKHKIEIKKLKNELDNL